MHLTALQILGPDWLRLVLLMPWRLDSAGGQTPATPPHLAVDSCVLQDDGQDDSWAVVVASYLWTRIGGFDEAFVLPYFPDMVARISLAGKVGYVADQDTAGICLPLADGLDTQWAKQLSCLPPAYQDQTEATILARIRNLSETRIGQGQVIRDTPRQAPMWAPAVRAKPVLLELLVTPMPTTDEEAEQVDWGAEEDLEQIALTTFKARAADFLAAATAWSPAEPAAAAARPPALGTLYFYGMHAYAAFTFLHTCTVWVEFHGVHAYAAFACLVLDGLTLTYAGIHAHTFVTSTTSCNQVRIYAHAYVHARANLQ